ncbi:hypothetical protein OUZ56_003114 [Daphnia magna]|uniref:Uncharacterized protein n=1 Tax=Daphnia magna TaxID=35525 RepID=A0ABR0A7T1_9CRUS|nr:hypothetical protein OUZ56_003114 [Daphnia magna]
MNKVLNCAVCQSEHHQSVIGGLVVVPGMSCCYLLLSIILPCSAPRVFCKTVIEVYTVDLYKSDPYYRTSKRDAFSAITAMMKHIKIDSVFPRQQAVLGLQYILYISSTTVTRSSFFVSSTLPPQLPILSFFASKPSSFHSCESYGIMQIGQRQY